MTHFRIGDKVRVVGLISSQWQDWNGTVVEIVDHGPYEQFGIIQECAVDVGGQRRWFMGKHLAKTASVARVRLFQAEVLARWQFEPGDIAGLNEDRNELADLLRRRFEFAARRAESEADEFLMMFEERLTRATDKSPEKEAPPQDTNKHSLKNAA